MSEKDTTSVLGKRKRAKPPIDAPMAQRRRWDEIQPVFCGPHEHCLELQQLLAATCDVDICPDSSDPDMCVVRAEKAEAPSVARLRVVERWISDTHDRPGPGWHADGVMITSNSGTARVGDLGLLPAPALYLGDVQAWGPVRLPQVLQDLRLRFTHIRSMLPFLEAVKHTRAWKLVAIWAGFHNLGEDLRQLSEALGQASDVRRLCLVSKYGNWVDLDLPLAANLEYLYVCGGLRLKCGARGPKALSLSHPIQLQGPALATVESLFLSRVDGSLLHCAGAINVVNLGLTKPRGLLLLLDRLQTVYLSQYHTMTAADWQICVSTYRRLRYATYDEDTEVEKPLTLRPEWVQTNELLQYPEAQTQLASYHPDTMIDLNLIVGLARMARRPRLSLREQCMQQATALNLSGRAVGVGNLPAHLRVEIAQRVKEAWNM